MFSSRNRGAIIGFFPLASFAAWHGRSLVFQFLFSLPWKVETSYYCIQFTQRRGSKIWKKYEKNVPSPDERTSPQMVQKPSPKKNSRENGRCCNKNCVCGLAPYSEYRNVLGVIPVTVGEWMSVVYSHPVLKMESSWLEYWEVGASPRLKNYPRHRQVAFWHQNADSGFTIFNTLNNGNFHDQLHPNIQISLPFEAPSHPFFF